MARTRAQQNRAIRQEALREQLATQGHLEQVFDCAKKMDQPGMERDEIYRLKTKADLHLALVDKYLPSLKAVEIQQSQDLDEFDDIDLDAAIRALTAEAGAIPPAKGKGGETTH